MLATELIATAAMPGVTHLRDALGAHMTLLTGQRRALLLDAGYGLCDLRAVLRKWTALPTTVLCTHAHYDHILGCLCLPSACLSREDYPARKQATDGKQRQRVLSRVDAEGLTFSDAQRSRYLSMDSDPFIPLTEDTFELGGLTAHVVPMPGHTRGSIGLWVPQRRLLLAGDNLNPVVWLFFRDSLPLARYAETMQSLLSIPFEHALCPHADRLYSRVEVEAFVVGLQSPARRFGRSVAIPPYTDICTVRLSPARGFALVVDGERDGIQCR